MKELSKGLNSLPTDENVDHFDDLGKLKEWTKSEFAKIRTFYEAIGQINSINMDKFESLSQATSEEIMAMISDSDRPAQTGLILRHLERFSEPLVLLDHSLQFTPLRYTIFFQNSTKIKKSLIVKFKIFHFS